MRYFLLTLDDVDADRLTIQGRMPRLARRAPHGDLTPEE